MLKYLYCRTKRSTALLEYSSTLYGRLLTLDSKLYITVVLLRVQDVSSRDSRLQGAGGQVVEFLGLMFDPCLERVTIR
jgi:hypothetical protein